MGPKDAEFQRLRSNGLSFLKNNASDPLAGTSQLDLEREMEKEMSKETQSHGYGWTCRRIT